MHDERDGGGAGRCSRAQHGKCAPIGDVARGLARLAPPGARAGAGCGDDHRLLTSGVRIGTLPTGPTNSVRRRAGRRPRPLHRRLRRCSAPVRAGSRAHRRDRRRPRRRHLGAPGVAGVAVLNGAGELTARSQVDEWGLLETPVFLTSTMQVGRVYDAACRLLMAEQPRIGVDDVVIPMVGECDDSWLNDPRHMHVTDEHVAAALFAARASAGSGVAPEVGAVGAGTGMSCFNWKGGIGTSSRVLPDGHVVGVVLLTNFGQWDRLTVAVGGSRRGWRARCAAARLPPPPAGSCLGVVVTDAPLDHTACERLATRVGLGLARTGSTAHHSSGEIFVAARSACARRGEAPTAPIPGRGLDPYFEAVVDAAEEAVLVSLLYATTTTGRRGLTVPALPQGAARSPAGGPR